MLLDNTSGLVTEPTAVALLAPVFGLNTSQSVSAYSAAETSCHS